MHLLKHKFNPLAYIMPRKSRISNQPRMWATNLAKRSLYHEMTEEPMTPKLAMMAIEAIMVQMGCVIELIRGYDPRRDEFYITANRARDGKFRNYTIPGETVASVVKDARNRIQAATGTRPKLELRSDRQWTKSKSP